MGPPETMTMIYDYECPCCAHEWEAEQKMTDPPLVSCPKCLVAAARRVVSGGQGFLLKGGGWASENYAKSEIKKDDV